MSDDSKDAVHSLISSEALVKFLEEKFERKYIEIEDEKMREALDILNRLSWARHANSFMFTELCAKLSDLVDIDI